MNSWIAFFASKGSSFVAAAGNSDVPRVKAVNPINSFRKSISAPSGDILLEKSDAVVVLATHFHLDCRPIMSYIQKRQFFCQ
jgi:hypothetical protein